MPINSIYIITIKKPW